MINIPDNRHHIDLRKEHREIIKEYGHFVLLQRTDRKFRCSCWNESYREADSNCPKCLGTGFLYRIERHRVRRDHASQVMSRPDLNQPTEIGNVHQPARIFWMSAEANPREGDVIYEVGWKGNKPTHVIGAYEINDTEDKRADNGRIEYYYVATSDKKSVRNVANIVVRKWGMKSNYEFVYKTR